MKVIDAHAHIVDREYLEELTAFMGLTSSKTEAGQTLLRKGNSTVAWFREDFFTPEDMQGKVVVGRLRTLSFQYLYYAFLFPFFFSYKC